MNPKLASFFIVLPLMALSEACTENTPSPQGSHETVKTPTAPKMPVNISSNKSKDQLSVVARNQPLLIDNALAPAVQAIKGLGDQTLALEVFSNDMPRLQEAAQQILALYKVGLDNMCNFLGHDKESLEQAKYDCQGVVAACKAGNLELVLTEQNYKDQVSTLIKDFTGEEANKCLAIFGETAKKWSTIGCNSSEDHINAVRKSTETLAQEGPEKCRDFFTKL